MISTLFKKQDEVVEENAQKQDEIVSDDISGQVVEENATETIDENHLSDDAVVEPVADVEEITLNGKNVSIADATWEQEVSEDNTWETHETWDISTEIRKVLDSYPSTEFDTVNLKNKIYTIINKK